MSDKSRVFVASSSEQIEVARRVAEALDVSPDVSAHIWEEDVFDFSVSYIESLERELDRADFAVVVLTADDPANVRKKKVNLPRDNVVFELGLFIGRLGRERCFFFVDGATDTRIASDLSGVKPVKFFGTQDEGDSRKPSLESQAHKVLRQMLKLGARYKPAPGVREKQDELWQFSMRVAGNWWERMRAGEDDKSALSYVTISVNPFTNAPSLSAQAFDRAGQNLANWESIITGVLRDRRWKIFYRWEGEHDAEIGQRYGGGGQIEFDDDDLSTGFGFYYDTNFARLPEVATTRIKHFGMYRCEPREVAVMNTPWTQEAKILLRRKLEQLSGR